jgi:hypothetical protein
MFKAKPHPGEQRTARGGRSCRGSHRRLSQNLLADGDGEKAPGHPHELIIALGGDYVVKGVRYLLRQDGKIGGMVTRYGFYMSEDEKNWGELAAIGAFSRDIKEKEVVFSRVDGELREIGVLTSST